MATEDTTKESKVTRTRKSKTEVEASLSDGSVRLLSGILYTPAQ